MNKDFLKGLNYDKQTGLFTWNVNKGKVKKGDVAGTNVNGYTQINFKGKRMYAHILAWYYENNYLPKYPLEEIDHINGNKKDNRISNLRLVNKSQNGQNKRKAQINNRSGSKIPGVSYNKRDNVYVVTLKINNKLKNCGSFKDLNEAENHCLNLRRKYYKYNTL